MASIAKRLPCERRHDKPSHPLTKQVQEHHPRPSDSRPNELTKRKKHAHMHRTHPDCFTYVHFVGTHSHRPVVSGNPKIRPKPEPSRPTPHPQYTHSNTEPKSCRRDAQTAISSIAFATRLQNNIKSCNHPIPTHCKVLRQ